MSDNPAASPAPEPWPFKPETWPDDADGFKPNLCTVCGTPLRYGSRHVKCAPGYVAAQAAQPAEMPDEPTYDKNLRRLTGLWRFGREVLPTAPVSFEAFLFQLDTLIDSKAPNPLGGTKE